MLARGTFDSPLVCLRRAQSSGTVGVHLQDVQKAGLLTRPPRRAKTRRSAGKAAAR